MDTAVAETAIQIGERRVRRAIGVDHQLAGGGGPDLVDDVLLVLVAGQLATIFRNEVDVPAVHADVAYLLQFVPAQRQHVASRLCQLCVEHLADFVTGVDIAGYRGKYPDADGGTQQNGEQAGADGAVDHGLSMT